jgi:aerobic carbon-monoxide dehydrogenase small subunit
VICRPGPFSRRGSPWFTTFAKRGIMTEVAHAHADGGGRRHARLQRGSDVQIRVTVNGVAHDSDVEPRTLLVHYVREALGLTGTNIGCDTSSCGACSLHLDGEAVKSCTVLAAQADGHEVTTIEGLARDGQMHPMQQAFMENHGLQCGYCTPGMVMAATSLLQENPNPTEQDVRIGLEGNLCRCTGYHNIVQAVLAAAQQ